MYLNKDNRGGKRKGAGRKPAPKTVVIYKRVDARIADELKQVIKVEIQRLLQNIT